MAFRSTGVSARPRRDVGGGGRGRQRAWVRGAERACPGAADESHRRCARPTRGRAPRGCAAHTPRTHSAAPLDCTADKVCGCVEPKEPDPLLYNRTYTQRLDRWRADKPVNDLMGPTAVDVQGVKDLLAKSGARGAFPVSREHLEGRSAPARCVACRRVVHTPAYKRPMLAHANDLRTTFSDFIGVSGYAPLVRPLDAAGAMEISWETAGYEFEFFGIRLKDLAKSGKRLVYRCASLHTNCIADCMWAQCSTFSSTWDVPAHARSALTPPRQLGPT